MPPSDAQPPPPAAKSRRVPPHPAAQEPHPPDNPEPAPAPPAEDPPKQRGGTGWFWLIALGLLLALGALAALGVFPRRKRGTERQQTGEAQQAGARTVQVVRPQRSPASYEFSLPGNTQALQETVLYARTNGYLRERLADIGDRVESGQLLARIEAPDVDAQLRAAQAGLEQSRAAFNIARVTFERQKKLLSEKVTSQQEFDQADATFRQADANVKTAEANVQNLSVQQGFQRITAPFTGVVTERNLDVGALISVGANSAAPSLFKLAQTDVLRVFIAVPQAYSASIRNGQEVGITAPQFPRETFKGKVTRSADALDPVARTERVEIQLPSEGGKLLPGMYLTVRFTVSQSEPVLLVPAGVLDVRREGPRVAIVTSAKKITYRPVTLGRDFGATVEVASGLNGDEQLVVNPTTDLSEGEPVEVAQPEPKKG